MMPKQVEIEPIDALSFYSQPNKTVAKKSTTEVIDSNQSNDINSNNPLSKVTKKNVLNSLINLFNIDL